MTVFLLAISTMTKLKTHLPKAKEGNDVKTTATTAPKKQSPIIYTIHFSEVILSALIHHCHVPGTTVHTEDAGMGEKWPRQEVIIRWDRRLEMQVSAMRWDKHYMHGVVWCE